MLYLSKTLSAMVLMRMYEVNNVLCTTGKTSMGWATLIVLFRRDDMREQTFWWLDFDVGSQELDNYWFVT
jgi:hypothetical protein